MPTKERINQETEIKLWFILEDHIPILVQEVNVTHTPGVNSR